MRIRVAGLLCALLVACAGSESQRKTPTAKDIDLFGTFPNQETDLREALEAYCTSLLVGTRDTADLIDFESGDA